MAASSRNNSSNSNSSHGSRRSARLAAAAAAARNNDEEGSRVESHPPVEETEASTGPTGTFSSSDSAQVDGPGDEDDFQVYISPAERKRGARETRASAAAQLSRSYAPSQYDPTIAKWERGKQPAAIKSSGAYKIGSFKGGPSRDPESSTNNSVRRRSAGPRSADAGIHKPFIIRKPALERRKAYSRGTVIRLPFHVPNLRPDATPNDEGMTATGHGLVYSDRRMAVVLWRFTENMTCVPLYSFQGQGITRQRKECHREYMEITNSADVRGYKKQGVYPVLAGDMTEPFTKLGCVHVTGVFHVNYEEKIEILGKLTGDSVTRLMAVWETLAGESDAEETLTVAQS